MSDEEEESMSEGFSASEEEWNPGKEVRNGESSDDDDSDFEEIPKVINKGGRTGIINPVVSKKYPKLAGVVKQTGAGAKKRKPGGQSLREKLYNKYRPPPKSLPSPTSGQNSPSASTSRGQSKNYQTPNEDNEEDSDSDDSVANYLVNPDDIDLRSNFYRGMRVADNDAGQEQSASPVPNFDCNAGLKQLSDSDSEDNETSNEEKPLREQQTTTAFNFLNIIENVNNIERAKQAIAKGKEQKTLKTTATTTNVMDVNSLLALGEKLNKKDVPKQNKTHVNDEDDDEEALKETVGKLSKTKSTRVKRHTKTRPSSTVANGDTDDSEWEEVADSSNLSQGNKSYQPTENLEIHLDMPGNRRHKKGEKVQTKLDLQNAFRRRINRNLKDRQVLLHKTSLLCHLGRTFYYNRLLNDKTLMQASLKLLPSKNSYPSEGGTEIKYFASLATWYKTTMKLQENRFYAGHPRQQLKRKYLTGQLLEQIKHKQASCKQDMIFIFVILCRGMGVHCRLIANLQPLPMKPAASDLLPMLLKSDKSDGDDGKKKESVPKKKIKIDKSPQKNSEKHDDKKYRNVKSEQKSVVPKKKEIVEDSDEVLNVQEEGKRTRSRAKQVTQEKEIQEAVMKKNNALPTPVARRTRNAKNSKVETRTEQKDAAAEKKVAAGEEKSQFFQPTEAVGRVLRQRNKNIPVEAPPKKSKLTIPQLDGADDIVLAKDAKPTRKKRPQLRKLRSRGDAMEEAGSEEDFQPSPPKKAKAPKPTAKQPPNRHVLSSDEEKADDGEVDEKFDLKNLKRNPNAVDMWVEAWSEAEEQWICIDIFTGKVHSVEAIRKSASSYMSYVYAFQGDLSIKDVTARYANNWSNVIRKLRVDKDWLEEALKPFRGRRTKRDIVEDQEMRRIHEEKPLPTAISDYKNHPLYVLERHLLKYEAIYPPDAPTLGFVRNEPVYARECVHNLHTREIWFKEARVVKPGETAYKVKLRPKWDKVNRKILKNQPMDLFGYWQTMDYDPPAAENGLVPRNEYGNVEVFKDCMLPKKCVHLKLPGLMRVCKKLNIDCANAVVGFDFHQGFCHAQYDGFIICEEFKDLVVDAWNQEQEEIERKAQEKFEARVYGNWKKLIRGLVIRTRIKNKYNI